MKIVVFGATGPTGRHVVERALELGHEVTAFVRNPSGLSLSHPALNVQQGDVLDPAAADTARDVRFRPKLNSESAPGERELIGCRSHADTAKSTRRRTRPLDEYRLILTGYEASAASRMRGASRSG